MVLPRYTKLKRGMYIKSATILYGKFNREINLYPSFFKILNTVPMFGRQKQFPKPI